VRLPDVDTPAFHAAYAALLAEKAPLGRYTPGSVAHTIEIYLNSADFDQLAPATKRDYRRYLLRLDRSVGDKPITAVDMAYIHAVRDRLKSTPVAASGDGYRRWDERQIALFRASAPPMMRLAFELGLYTGQRLSDVIRLAWSNYDGARIRLRQQKTGTTLSIPVHPDLKALLDETARRGLTILTTVTGRSYHPRVFSREFLEARQAVEGLEPDLSFHGLRHTAAARLAELGSGAPEIQAITGHKSLKLVEHYIRQASQERQADRAISRLPKR